MGVLPTSQQCRVPLHVLTHWQTSPTPIITQSSTLYLPQCQKHKRNAYNPITKQKCQFFSSLAAQPACGCAAGAGHPSLTVLAASTTCSTAPGLLPILLLSHPRGLMPCCLPSWSSSRNLPSEGSFRKDLPSWCSPSGRISWNSCGK